MIGRNILEEDIQLKRFATTPSDQKPRFNWGDYAQSQAEADATEKATKDAGDALDSALGGLNR